MAQSKNTPALTIKHATLKMMPSSVSSEDQYYVEYETYTLNRTGRKHVWMCPPGYSEIFLEFLSEHRPEVLERLLDPEDFNVSLSVWSDTATCEKTGRTLFYWTNVELTKSNPFTRSYYTDEIDRKKTPKINKNHRNDNEL